MIGAKTLVTMTLLTAGVVAAFAFGVFSPERLASRGFGTLFLVGAFAVVVGTLMFRFWRLGEPSLHYFRWATDTKQWSSAHEAHFVGTERRRITLGDNRGEAFDLGPRLHQAVCVAIALLLALGCIDSRALGLLGRFEHSVGGAGSSYCPEPDAEPTTNVDPNVPGCELIRRAYALGYAKSLGQCEAQKKRATASADCTRRRRDEPALHYAWRLLNRSWTSLRKHTEPAYFAGLEHDFGARVDRLGSLGRAERQMLASAPRASHHIWTNLPDPGDGAFREQTCAERYRSVAHRPAPPAGDKRASKVFEHVLAQLLFESRYEPAAGSCREYHVHWGAPLAACQRLAANPEAALASVSALADVEVVLDRRRLAHERAASPAPPLEPSAVVSFQCYFEGDGAEHKSTPLTLGGQRFSVEELRVPPSPPGATLYVDRYDAVAKLLVHGFHYGALLSEAGIEPGASDGLQAAFAGHDFLLTRLHGLDSLDIYLDAGWIAARPDLLEVYPYERHLKNYVEIFRRQYARVRGRL
ncbi:MAG: hypothetical protein JWM53_193 [bacterium]|nr:hypothetical protein [bacterium]